MLCQQEGLHHHHPPTYTNTENCTPPRTKSKPKQNYFVKKESKQAMVYRNWVPSTRWKLLQPSLPSTPHPIYNSKTTYAYQIKHAVANGSLWQNGRCAGRPPPVESGGPPRTHHRPGRIQWPTIPPRHVARQQVAYYLQVSVGR